MMRILALSIALVPCAEGSEIRADDWCRVSGLHLSHESETPATVTIEVDRRGTGRWSKLLDVRLDRGEYRWFPFDEDEEGAWLRLGSDTPLVGATAWFSCRGLFVLSGVSLAAAGENRHIVRSDDGKTALWVGAVDDLWQLGKPVGAGGPWRNTRVEGGIPSDPYLMTGYDKKTLVLSHTASSAPP